MNWYASFSKAERTTFHSAFTGWVLDAFDFMVFTFVVTSLMTLWGVGKGEIGLLSTVSLLCSAVGGWVARHPRGSLRPRQGPAVDHRLVLGIHLPDRLVPERRTTVCPACVARLRFWGRVGRWRGIDR